MKTVFHYATGRRVQWACVVLLLIGLISWFHAQHSMRMARVEKEKRDRVYSDGACGAEVVSLVEI